MVSELQTAKGGIRVQSADRRSSVVGGNNGLYPHTATAAMPTPDTGEGSRASGVRALQAGVQDCRRRRRCQVLRPTDGHCVSWWKDVRG